jgi:histidyl-tRNA synthetase
MTKILSAPKGTYDILPEETPAWRRIENIAREVMQNYGYREIRLPIFEYSELFERSVGENTDIVAKEMYTFTDRGGRQLSLRPEGTASAVRLLLQHKLYDKGPFQKLYYFGPMFRAERPAKGRNRQFYQFGIEAIGQEAATVDAEALCMLHDLFKRLEVGKLDLVINSVGCRICRPGYRQRLVNFLNGIGSSLCKDCQERIKKNPLRTLDCKVEKCKETLTGAPSILDHLCQGCRDHFSLLKQTLKRMDISYRVDSHLVRGLDYYTRTAFEYTSSALGGQNAVAAGGRYDDLVRQLGGPQKPAFGFAVGMERLLIILNQKVPAPKPRVFLAHMGNQAREAGLLLLRDLREKGIAAEMIHDPKSLKAQMRLADKSGAAYTVILGEEELKENKITLRNMNLSTEQVISRQFLLQYLLQKDHPES